jgi:hypothetical protein
MEPTIPDYPRGITFEQVWAALMEDREHLKEYQKEAAERQKEAAERQQKEAAERQKEAAERQKEAAERQKEDEKRKKEFDEWKREIDRLVMENNKQIGGLHRSFGELAEHLVAPGIAKRFNELGYHFDSISPGGRRLLDTQGRTLTEIDIVLENGEFIVAVEVKTKPVEQDIEHHVKRLEILRKNRDKHGDKRKICGAIAGAVFPQEVKKAAIKAGFYVLEQSGDTMKIDIPQDFVPQEW